MSESGATASERQESWEATGTNAWDRAKAVATRSGRSGALAALAGAGLLARAFLSRGRRAPQALAGAALVGIGLRQRRSDGAATAGGETTSSGSGETTSAEADPSPGGSLATQDRLEEGRGDVNPRGTSGEPDVETETAPDEGDVQFVEDRDGEPRSKPQLDGDDPDDPRRADSNGDESVEVDLSEASMADEASEATGPSPEQSYPSLEGTDPEPMSEKAPQRYGEGEGDEEAENEERQE